MKSQIYHLLGWFTQATQTQMQMQVQTQLNTWTTTMQTQTQNQVPMQAMEKFWFPNVLAFELMAVHCISHVWAEATQRQMQTRWKILVQYASMV